jgi:ganglioside GM2 activator
METKVAGFWIKIPCVDNLGSCSYTDICKNWAELCPKYFEKYGLPCTCPIPANTYTVSDFVAFISDKLPIKVKGDVRITGNFVSPSAGHLSCLQLEVTIQS